MRKLSFIAALIIIIAIVWNSSSTSESVLSEKDEKRGKSSSAPGQSVDNYGRNKKNEVAPAPGASLSPSLPLLEAPELSSTPYPTFEPTQTSAPVTKIIQIIPVAPSGSTSETPKIIEVRTENQKENVNLSDPGTSLKIEQAGGRITIKARRPDGQEIKLDREEVINMQALFLPESIAEKAEVENISERLYVLKYKDTIAETFIPLSAILGEVSAITNFGEKNITFFPSDAVETLVNKEIITGTKDIALVLDENGEVKALNRKVRLITFDRELAYEIDGVKKEYFLGFSVFPVEINKKITISEESKEVLKVDQNLKEKLKDFFSY